MCIKSGPNFVALWHLQIFSAVCLGAFLFTNAVLAQVPLRANGKIAFTSDRDGNPEIYVMNADGANQIRITSNPGADDSPTWSPDGRKIAFVSQKQNGSFAIFTMNADGTDQTEITALNGSTEWAPWKPLSWSPDGGRIAFHDYSAVSNGIDIFVVNLDGSGRQNLTADHAHLDLEPVWSPDGSKILFSRYGVYPPSGYGGTMLHTINVDGTNLTPLANGFADGWNEDSAAWSAALNKIVYSVNVWDFNNSIFIANADGTNRQFFDGCPDFPCISDDRLSPNWSPDGRKIIFSIWDRFHTNAEIYVKNIDGSGLIQLTDTAGRNFDPSWQPLVSARACADFDGDRRGDISVFRPSDRIWYLNQSTNGFSATQFGLSTDKITPADFDGDGKTDIAVFRDGNWYWLNSSNGNFNAIQFGLAGDIPVPADFTGDGRSELAVYRSGFWYTLNLANNQFQAVQFGLATDKPVASDYDGDSRADYAVYRDGFWYLLQSAQGFAAIQFGLSTDRLVPADYDGDGKTDLAVYRDGEWYLRQSSQGFTAFQFGLADDIPAPADYDGDGRADAAVYRDGTWYLLQTTNGFSAQQFGVVSDKPVPSAYLP